MRTRLLFPYWIDMSVPIFMFISGYVGSLSNIRHKIDGLTDSYTLNNIMRKGIRYTIPFLITFLVEETLFWLDPQTKYSLFEIVMHFLSGGVGQGSYYYPVMMQFIFTFPVIDIVVKRYKGKGLLICFIVNLSYEILKTAYLMNEECYRLLMFRYIFIIAAGAYCANDFKIKHERIVSLSCILIGAAYIFIMCYTNYEPLFFSYWSGRSMIGCLFIIPFVYRILRKANWHNKSLELLGKASYNIFFTQMLYYLYFERIYNYITNDMLILCVSILSCSLGGVAFYLVENPNTNKLIEKIGEKL